MRDLASVCTIEKVWPLEGKDRVVGASFVENSYEVMVGKDTKPGDLVAFIQEGSILPEIPAWEFLRARCWKDSVKGFVIKPMKFASIRSWGLAVKLDELPLAPDVIEKLKAGDDLTDYLEIRKYEPEEDSLPKKGSSKKAYPKFIKFCLSHAVTRWIGRIYQKKHQNVSGGFPTHLISMSDETTIQNLKGILETHQNESVYITAKMEGQSFTVIPTFGKFLFWKRCTGAYVCSRKNAYILEDNTLFWDMMKKYNIVKKMKAYYKKYKKAVIFQGEQCGLGIQKNIYDLPENKWFIYTVKDFDTRNQLPFYQAIEVAAEFGLDFVPVLESNVILGDVMPNVEAAVAYAEQASWVPGNYKMHPNGDLWKDYFQHEGVVVRSMTCDKDKGIGISFKVKNLAYNQKGLDAIHTACINFKIGESKKHVR